MTKVAAIVGGYLGDEGKAKITVHYVEKYLAEALKRGSAVLNARTSGGTNTGATFYRDGIRIQVHQLPVGVFMPGAIHGYIGTGCYINPDILVRELGMLAGITERDEPHRIFISKFAHVVTQDHLNADAKKESSQKLGSTKNGVSIAAGAKYHYQGTRVVDLPESVTGIWGQFGVEIIDPYELFEEIVNPGGWNVVIEGSQGVGLDVNHGFDYPYVSAGSFSTFGLLDGVGYALAPDEVVMCLKAYGSYFGPIRMGKADFEDDEFRRFAGEYGTTTKRPRNLCWLDTKLIQRAAQLVQPTVVVVNHLDTLGFFPDNNKVWKLIVDDEKEMGFGDKAWINNKLTRQGALFLDTIKEASNVRRMLLGVGPKSDDLREY